MDERQKIREWASKQIIDKRVYVESVGKKIGDRMHYDFMICRVDDGKPILWVPFIYDSEKDALFGGYLRISRTQQRGNLERLAA